MSARTENEHYKDLLRALARDIEEEADHLRKLITDEDSSCPARKLRIARLAAFDHVLGLLKVYETWDW